MVAVAIVVTMAVAALMILTIPDQSDLRDLTGEVRPSPDSINLVAVQMRAEESAFFSASDFCVTVETLMAQADAEAGLGPDTLVVFPEHMGTFTVMFDNRSAVEEADDLTQAVEGVIRDNLVRIGWPKLRHWVSWPRALFLSRQGSMAEAYFEVFSALAREYETYIVAGTGSFTDAAMSRYVPDGIPGAPESGWRSNSRDVYNASVVFGPDGAILGVARKVHLIELEGPEGLDFEAGELDRLEPIPTSLGSLGIAICLDAFRDDVLDALEAMGAEILIQPSANPGPWEPWQQEEWLESSWRAVHEEGRFAYAVNPMLTGYILDLGFYGQSAIMTSAPDLIHGMTGYPHTGPMDGFLAVAADDSGQYIIHSRVPHPGHLTD